MTPGATGNGLGHAEHAALGVGRIDVERHRAAGVGRVGGVGNGWTMERQLGQSAGRLRQGG